MPPALMEKKKPSKRVLILADFVCNSGFAQVAHNVVAQLLRDEEIDYYIDVVGINYYGLPNEWQQFNPRVRVFPATVISNGDLFGRNGILQMLQSGVFDILWILQDTFQIEPITQNIIDIRNKLVEHGGKPFKFIFYYPIDATPKENWITKSVSLADIPVAYTQYGFDESVKFDEGLRNKLKIIPHGIDENVFNVLPPEEVAKFRTHFFKGFADDKFLIINVNRNQPRKDIARTMQIFSLLKRQVPEAFLYLHMKASDVAYNLDEVARLYDLIPEKDYLIPANFNEHDGIEAELLNYIYNASDCVMSTSLGEGWGLSLTEAMATKTPVIAPNHSAIAELLADGRGTLVTAGKTLKDWIVLSNDNERQRPIVDVPEFVDKLAWIRNNREEAAKMAEKAYVHVRNNWTWNIVGKQWRDVFKTAIPTPRKIVIGRNDPCHCGSGKKFKHCHYGK